MKWVAGGVVATLSLAYVLLYTGALVAGSFDSSVKGLAAIIAILAGITAVAYSPLVASGGWFRLSVGAVGLASLFGGLLLLTLLVGIPLLALGFVYLALALTPDSWSASRVLVWAFLVPAGLVAITGMVAGIGSLIEAGQR